MTFDEKKYYAGLAGEITGVLFINVLWIALLRLGWNLEWWFCIFFALMMTIFDVRISFRRWRGRSPQETASE